MSTPWWLWLLCSVLCFAGVGGVPYLGAAGVSLFAVLVITEILRTQDEKPEV